MRHQQQYDQIGVGVGRVPWAGLWENTEKKRSVCVCVCVGTWHCNMQRSQTSGKPTAQSNWKGDSCLDSQHSTCDSLTISQSISLGAALLAFCSASLHQSGLSWYAAAVCFLLNAQDERDPPALALFTAALSVRWAGKKDSHFTLQLLASGRWETSLITSSNHLQLLTFLWLALSALLDPFQRMRWQSV